MTNEIIEIKGDLMGGEVISRRLEYRVGGENIEK